jgi:hypothetical protein
MKRVCSAAALSVFFAVVGFVGVARASAPTIEPFTATADMVDTSLCTFPVTVHVVWTGSVATFYDQNGTPVRAQQRFHEVDSFTAHGTTLVGVENTHQSITFVGGQPSTLTVHGLLFTHVLLPSGGVFLGSVGRVVLDINGNVVSFHGMPPTAPPAQTSQLCAALS